MPRTIEVSVRGERYMLEGRRQAYVVALWLVLVAADVEHWRVTHERLIPYCILVLVAAAAAWLVVRASPTGARNWAVVGVWLGAFMVFLPLAAHRWDASGLLAATPCAVLDASAVLVCGLWARALCDRRRMDLATRTTGDAVALLRDAPEPAADLGRTLVRPAYALRSGPESGHLLGNSTGRKRRRRRPGKAQVPK